MGRKKEIALTRLETEIMSAVWDLAPNPVSVRDVLERVNRSRKKKLAYNTVHTVISILKDKGFVRQAGASGRAHQFVALISRQHAGKQLVVELARRLFGGQLQPMIHHIIDDAQLTTEQLHELRAWVDEKLNDTEKED